MIRKGQGFTIMDSLDAILLMGLAKEFEEAKAWVRDELDSDQDGEVNLFVATISVLGGLLAAYDQSGKEPVFLNKAVDLADRLMGPLKHPVVSPVRACIWERGVVCQSRPWHQLYIRGGDSAIGVQVLVVPDRG